MIRAIVLKEWREHRSKYLGYWFTLNTPVLVLALALGLTSAARVPFADLSDANSMKYLPLSLIESLLVASIFLILTGYLAVATFAPEIEDHSLFFMFEQPLSRAKYAAIKLLNGAGHVVLGTCSAVLLFPIVTWGIMLLSGKVTVAGSSQALGLVMALAGRAAVWSALLSLAAFTASALISALVPRWWLAALCSVLLSIAAIIWGIDFFFFDFFPDSPGGESMNVSAGFGTGHAKWVEVSRAFHPAELNVVAHWRAWPFLTEFLMIAAFSVAIALLYNRKELK